MRSQTKRIYDRHGITVYETNELYGEKGSFRALQFADGAMQGAMDLNDPERIVFEYPRAIIHLMELNRPDFESALMIGHGIGTIAMRYSEDRFAIAEQEQTVVDISRSYFGYNKNNVSIGDGREILERQDPHSFDYIIVDAFTEKGTPHALLSQSFFAMARDKLTPGGSIILNLMGKGEKDGLIRAVFTTMGEVFACSKAFALSQDGATGTKNIILAAGGRPIRYQAKQMAGFENIEPGQGYVIT